jgi:hypothetical protein
MCKSMLGVDRREPHAVGCVDIAFGTAGWGIAFRISPRIIHLDEYGSWQGRTSVWSSRYQAAVFC